MSANLFTCYSPSGEKFELTRPNYLDATQNFGFTTNAPGAAPAADEGDEDDAAEAERLAAEAEAAAASEPATEPTTAEGETTATDEQPATDAPAEEPTTEAPAFDPEDKDSVKAYLRKNEIQFDGRASLADLVALANGEAAE
ncbi:hypothetical protein vBCbaSRXM_147 [Citromicrobium phage vB_CbaS-RXM]|nr:hypothetical protein vBCbaSRXM_147 [Citromicrobium phage vB_CbaS-RXM]